MIVWTNWGKPELNAVDNNGYGSTAYFKDFKINITNEDIWAPEEWFVDCPELNINDVRLNLPNNSTLKEAQNKAIEIIREKLQNMLSELES